MKTIVCAIQKGGQGKSMLATHLAFLAAEQGKSVLAVDADGQGNFSRNLTAEPIDRNLSPSFSLFSAEALGAHSPTLTYAVKGEISFYTGDHRLTEVDENPEFTPQALRVALAKLNGRFDLCVIDPPPTLGKRLRASLMAADYVVMPFAPSRESLDGLGDLMDTIGLIKAQYNPALQVLGLLPNKVNSRSYAEHLILKQIKKEAPGMLIDLSINERTSIASAMAESRPVWKSGSGESQRNAASEVRAACTFILKTIFKKQGVHHGQ
jgi:chromosome partitioning protein